MVSEVSLAIGRGDVLALTGGPGAGKTSLLRALLGLLPISGGSVEYAADAGSDGGITSVVGAVFSEPALHPNRSVRAHLQILATGYRDSRARIAQVAARTGITDVLDRPARELDPGTSFRVALASALIAGPSVLLVDEPVFGQGAMLASAAPVIAGFTANGGAVVIAGRGLAELSSVATHATVLRKGHQSWSGRINELHARLRENFLVATPAQKQLALALAIEGITDVAIRYDGRLLVTGCAPDRVGRVATANGLPIQAIHPEHTSLDAIYAELAGVPPVVPWGFGPVAPLSQPGWVGAAR